MTSTRPTILRDSAAAIILATAAAGLSSAPTTDWVASEVGTTVYLPAAKYRVEKVDGDVLSIRYTGGLRDGQQSRFQRHILAVRETGQYDLEAVRQLWPLRPGNTVSFLYEDGKADKWHVHLSVLDRDNAGKPPEGFDATAVQMDTTAVVSRVREDYTHWYDRVTGIPVKTVSRITDSNGVTKRSATHVLRIDPPTLPTARPSTFDGTWTASATLDHVRDGGDPQFCRDYTYDITLNQGRVTHIDIFGRAVPNPITNDYFADPNTIDILWETSRGNTRIRGTFDGNTLKGSAASGNCLHSVEWRRK